MVECNYLFKVGFCFGFMRICDWQVVSGEEGDNFWYCGEKAAGCGAKVRCFYEFGDIRVGYSFGRPKIRAVMSNAQGGDGVCQDFEILPEAKERFLDELVGELGD